LGSDGSVVASSKNGRNDLVDLVRVVDEVQHGQVRLAFALGDAVEPGQRLHGGDAGQLLVDIHRRQQRLVEAGLVLLGHHQDAIFRLARGTATDGLVVSAGVSESLGQRGLRQPAVLLRLGDLLAVVGERARERHQDTKALVVAGHRCTS